MDGDYNHGIKRCGILGRKAMTNLNSVLKSRQQISVQSKCCCCCCCFPVVLYRCESWTIKKAKHWRCDAFKCWCFKKIKAVNPTGINPEYSLERLMVKLKLVYCGCLMGRGDSLEKSLMMGKIDSIRRRRQQRMMVIEHHRFNGHELEHIQGAREGQGSLFCCSPWACKESDMT